MKRTLLLMIISLAAAGCARELEFNDLQDVIPVETIDDTPRVTVIRAGFENPETKTSIQMTTDGTAAKVLWTAGDQIKLFGVTESNTYYNKIFQTQVGGVSSADFSCSDWNPNNRCIHYVAFYPADLVEGFGLTKIGVVIPSEQTAVPDGIAEKLNISYSSADSISEHFTFRNIPALIKFSLKGGITESIDHINFTANRNIAGEAVITDLDNENPTYKLNSWYGERVTPTNTVILSKPSGGFVASDDGNVVSYYIAVYPGTTEGFSMVFSNAEGDYVVKMSSKTLDLERSRITDFGTIDLGDSFGDPKVTKYMSKAGNAKPVDIAVIPDGYVEGQRELFESRAQSAMDLLFSTDPYKAYKDYFNVYFIWAASKEEGASVTDDETGEIITLRDTAFGSVWGEKTYSEMEADRDKVYGYVSAHCPEIISGDLTIDEVPVLILVNDPRYGGICHYSATGRSYCIVPRTLRNNSETISWSYMSTIPNTDEPILEEWGEDYYHTRTADEFAEVGGRNVGDWRNTVLHEYGGHCFGRLTDEYWSVSWPTDGQSDLSQHSWSVPYALNISGRYDPVPWAGLLERKASLVERNSLYDRIGVYQGGGGYIFNRWRSERISCMIDNRQYYSTWQRVLIAQRISGLAQIGFDIDTFLLTDNPVDPLRGSKVTESIVNSKGPIEDMPPLPMPVFDDEDTMVEIDSLF